MHNHDFNLNPIEKKSLLSLARHQLDKYFKTSTLPHFNEKEFKPSPQLKTCCGLFVSLYLDKNLRGCIGTFNTNKPLYKLVADMVLAAAINDNRFSPVTASEVQHLLIDISVLTPMKKIVSIEEIVLGEHGIYITDGLRSGTFLPQVATSTNWDLESFLGHCSRDKAGLGWDGWRTASIFTYTAIVFSENEF
jgi:MEMO1 family protein